MRCVAELSSAAVNRLIGRSSVETSVYALAPGPPRCGRIDSSAPARGADHRKAVGMASLHQCFTSPIAPLLTQVTSDRAPRVMPDQSRGMEPDLPVFVENPPAEIDVVSGNCIDGIEAAELLERCSSECHVAAGNVLGAVVR